MANVKTMQKPRLGLSEKATEMFNSNKTRKEVYDFLFKSYRKLGRNTEQAKRNANSAIWNATHNGHDSQSNTKKMSGRTTLVAQVQEAGKSIDNIHNVSDYAANQTEIDAIVEFLTGKIKMVPSRLKVAKKEESVVFKM